MVSRYAKPYYFITMIHVEIPAKVNKNLHITGRRNDFHLLSMETVSVNLFDAVDAEKSDVMHVEFAYAYDGFVAEKFLPEIEKTIEKFKATYGDVNANLSLYKRIPLGKGMGGSSAILYAVVCALAMLKNVQLDTPFLLSIGSDLPVIATGGRCHVEGIGEVVEKLSYEKKYLLVSFPPSSVNSKDAYKAYDESEKANGFENDLESVSVYLNGDIAKVKSLFSKIGVLNSVMTGSGSGVVTFFENKENCDVAFSKAKSELSALECGKSDVDVPFAKGVFDGVELTILQLETVNSFEK